MRFDAVLFVFSRFNEKQVALTKQESRQASSRIALEQNASTQGRDRLEVSALALARRRHLHVPASDVSDSLIAIALLQLPSTLSDFDAVLRRFRCDDVTSASRTVTDRRPCDLRCYCCSATETLLQSKSGLTSKF